MTEQRTRAKGMPRRILLAVLLVLATSVQALVPGNRYLVRHFGAGYGLSTGVNTAVRTQDGYLWLGTFGGLYRFDGTKATRFQVQRPGSKAGAGSGPASDRITALHEDVRGRLWIGTQDGGFTLYERGRFQLLPFCGGTCQVHAFVESPDQELWATTNTGLMRIDLRTLHADYMADPELGTFDQVAIRADKTVYVSGYKGLGKVVDDRIERLRPPRLSNDSGWRMQSVDGKLWVSEWKADGVIASFDPVTGHWQQTAMRGRPVASTDGHLWVNTDNGELFRVNDGALERISGLPPMWVTSVVVDRDGLYWVTSKEGLWSVQVENGLLTDADAAGVPYPGRAIAEDQDGGMWLGFSCGGLRYLPPQGGAELVDRPSLNNQCVGSLQRDRAGGLWVGTTSGLFHILGEKLQRIPLPHHLNSLQIWQADDGGLWLGAERHTYRLIRDKHGDYALSAPVTVLEGMVIAKMRTAQRGGIWFVGDQGAFRLVDGKLVEKWTLAEGLSSRFARTIHEDRHGTWIGTYGGGLNLIRDGKVHIYDESNGLHDNTVSCIAPDDLGRLWLGGNKGVSVIPRPDSHAWIESVPVKVSADSVSFEVNGGTQSACVRDSKGRFWFSLVQGFLTLDPDEYAKVEGPVPSVHIARVSSAGGTLDAANGMIELSPRVSSVQIEYVGINLTHPDLLSFRYRLSGQSADWAYTKTGRSISYENMPWGEHVFEVQAKNQGGRWSQSARFLISRPAPWYQRQWLWPLVGFCSLMLLVWRTRTTPQNDRHRQRVDRILAESQMRLNRKTGVSDKR